MPYTVDSTVSNEPKIQIIVIVQSLRIHTSDLNSKIQALACSLDSSTPLPTAEYVSVLYCHQLVFNKT